MAITFGIIVSFGDVIAHQGNQAQHRPVSMTSQNFNAAGNVTVFAQKQLLQSEAGVKPVNLALLEIVNAEQQVISG